MLVRLKQTWASPIGSGKAGDEVEVPTKVGKDLIKADAAVRADDVDEPAPSRPEVHSSGASHPDPQSAEKELSENEGGDAQAADDNAATDSSASEAPPAEEPSRQRPRIQLKRGNHEAPK